MNTYWVFSNYNTWYNIYLLQYLIQGLLVTTRDTMFTCYNTWYNVYLLQHLIQCLLVTTLDTMFTCYNTWYSVYLLQHLIQCLLVTTLDTMFTCYNTAYQLINFCSVRCRASLITNYIQSVGDKKMQCQVVVHEGGKRGSKSKH